MADLPQVGQRRGLDAVNHFEEFVDINKADDIIERPFADREPGVGGIRRVVEHDFDGLEEVEHLHVRVGSSPGRR